MSDVKAILQQIVDKYEQSGTSKAARTIATLQQLPTKNPAGFGLYCDGENLILLKHGQEVARWSSLDTIERHMLQQRMLLRLAKADIERETGSL